MCVHAQSLTRAWLFVTPWTAACQAPLSMGILQARMLEWVAIPVSMGSSQPSDWTHASSTGRWVLYHWATWEALLSHFSLPECVSTCKWWRVPGLSLWLFSPSLLLVCFYISYFSNENSYITIEKVSTLYVWNICTKEISRLVYFRFTPSLH